MIAGLARAGQLDVARQLVPYFAENDFFGGFGAEGDAPGQGLRVLEDVARRVHDPAFDRGLWPHIERKDMLAYVDESGPEPVLVIGAGVPRSWLTRPLMVRGLPTCLGTVDWTWTGNRLQTTVHGRRPVIRAAKIFPGP